MKQEILARLDGIAVDSSYPADFRALRSLMHQVPAPVSVGDAPERGEIWDGTKGMFVPKVYSLAEQELGEETDPGCQQRPPG